MSSASPPDFLPTATPATLRLRSVALTAVRQFFLDRGYCEVDTPCLSRDTVVDAWIDPVSVSYATHGQSAAQFWLQTSPEFAMKRLLAAGMTAIFQVARVFRHGEAGRNHNPEFTMVEWYRAGDDHHAQMQLTEDLLRHLVGCMTKALSTTDEYPHARTTIPETPFARMTYDAAFERYAGTRILHMGLHELRSLTVRHNVLLPTEIDREGARNQLFAELVESQLGHEQPVFLHDYPAAQAALARVREETPPVAERFELFWNGVELCNGYHELTDANELRRRIAEQNAIRRQHGAVELPTESRLLTAMDHGLPACAGVALGFDRLLQQTLGLPTLQDVIAFPFDRA